MLMVAITPPDETSVLSHHIHKFDDNDSEKPVLDETCSTKLLYVHTELLRVPTSLEVLQISRALRATKMRLVIQKEQKTVISQANSMESPQDWSDDEKKEIYRFRNERCDILRKISKRKLSISDKDAIEYELCEYVCTVIKNKKNCENPSVEHVKKFIREATTI